MSDIKQPLVTEAFKLRARIKADGEKLKEITERLIAEGPGDYLGLNGEKASVIAPGPNLKPSAEVVESLRDSLGDAFGKLFDKVVSYKPAKAFREIAGAVLSPAKAKKVIAQCEQESNPYVKFS